MISKQKAFNQSVQDHRNSFSFMKGQDLKGEKVTIPDTREVVTVIAIKMGVALLSNGRRLPVEHLIRKEQ